MGRFSIWRRPVALGLCAAALAMGASLATVAQSIPVPPRAAEPTRQPVTPTARLPEPDAPPAPQPITVPAEPRAAMAFAVLERHCARCHQGGRLDRVAPSGGFGNILRLDELARSPWLVRPGNPDGSRLYTAMVRGLMPFDLLQEGVAGDAPSPEEIASLREWITHLPTAARSCPDREPMTGSKIAEAIASVVEQAGPAAPRLRFVSLAHLYNSCDSDAEMVGWRQAIRSLVNSLSWRDQAVPVLPIDPARTILKVDLGDIGWVKGHWERILQSGANPMFRAIPLPPATLDKLDATIPVVRGDWLVDVVLQAPLYYELMGLPELGTEIDKILQIDAEGLRRSARAVRSTIRPSEFSDAGRLVERLESPKSTLWLGYTAALRPGGREPADPAPLQALPPHDAALGLFTLPNGLPGFYIAGPRSQRLDRVPPAVQRPSSGPTKGVRAALGCFSCHAGGPLLPVKSNSAVAGINALIASDRARIAQAQTRAGLFAGMTMDGVAPVAALARRFAAPLDAHRAAAELEADKPGLLGLAQAADSQTALLARRLSQGDVSRAQFERAAPRLLTALGAKALQPTPDAAVYPEERDSDAAAVLEVVTDKPSYKKGDPVVITVTTNADCHLTLVNIDRSGRGTVIFPSDFEQNNLLVAERELRVPRAGAPYRFRAGEPGRETIVANCSPSAQPIDGITHDFERQRFTDLGNYATFLTQALQKQQADRPKQPAPKAGSRGGWRGPAKATAAGVNRAVLPEEIARTAITFEVR